MQRRLHFDHVGFLARDLPAAARARDNAERLWRIVEAQLAGRDYIAGAFSIADITMGGFLHRWMRLPVARPDLPRVTAWYDRLKARGPYAAHVAVPLS